METFKFNRVIVLSKLDSSTQAVITALSGLSLTDINHFEDPEQALNDTHDVRKEQRLIGVVAIGESVINHRLLEPMTIQLRPDDEIEIHEIRDETIDTTVLNEIAEFFKKLRYLQY